ncbi:MAG: hypothetical protein LBV34_14550 [Nocardiopsaceae bacterium]|jgi:hypothetical protein|nr:hypothetical protein [Nocardiopsaceae bacterium]
MRDIWDDEQLLAALREALEADEAVPPEFIEVGKNAYAWHNIDAELAQLTYDSVREPDAALSLRAEAASIRALTFTSAHLTIELEVSEDSVLGQVIPAQSGVIEIQGREGTNATTEADEVGCFLIRPIPDSPFRLRFRTADGSDILTGSITL